MLDGTIAHTDAVEWIVFGYVNGTIFGIFLCGGLEEGGRCNDGMVVGIRLSQGWRVGAAMRWKSIAFVAVVPRWRLSIVVAQLEFIVGGIVGGIVVGIVGIVFFAQFGIYLKFSNIKYLPWYNGVEGDKFVNSRILKSKQKRLQSKW